MEYRNLGRSGLKVSELCLGTMQFGWTVDETKSFEILSAAIEAGINFIDTADVYPRMVPGHPGGLSETIIGKWLKESAIQREQVVIATKVRAPIGEGPNDEGLSRAHILNAVDDSLKRLNTDYIDLYQVHWYDENTPLEETLGTLDTLITQGKVRYIGASNHPAWRMMKALWTSEKHGLARYESLQPHYNFIHRAEFERELADVCTMYGLGVMPYSPLAWGFLTGKYQRGAPLPESERADRTRRRYFNQRNWTALDALEEIAREGGMSIAQTALAFLLSNPVVTCPIVGPRTIDHLRDNLGAVGVRLTGEEMDRLKTASSWTE
jgi:aryl-alcohol dehydrogenase-like predicted oxidoreductase